jgi:hypothetical protein
VTFDVAARSATAGGGQVRARFSYDRVLGTLTYALDLVDVRTEDVVAAVLLSEDDDGRESVVARLAGPGLEPIRGAISLDATQSERLETGELRLELMTRASPFGVSRGAPR